MPNCPGAAQVSFHFPLLGASPKPLFFIFSGDPGSIDDADLDSNLQFDGISEERGIALEDDWCVGAT